MLEGNVSTGEDHRSGRQAPRGDSERRFQTMVEHIPMNRAGESWEMAAAASFLLSDEAAYITGQIISINGGMV